MSLETQNPDIAGPLVALDLGHKRIGVALSDSLLISIRPLRRLKRSSWKQLLSDVSRLVRHYDARGLVIGLPLSLDGTRGSASTEVKGLAQKFSLSLDLPVYLQDERLTSVEAAERLGAEGHSRDEIKELIDSEAAVIILEDFIAQIPQQVPVPLTRRS